MNKTELIDAIAAKAGITKKQSKEAVSAFIEVTKEVLAKKDSLVIPGFASFKVINRPARQGRNVRTGEAMSLPAKNVVKFKAGTTLTEAVQ
jgi:DNA-binding protein HU-beta